MKRLTEVLHDSGGCDPATCPFCQSANTSLPPGDGLSSVGSVSAPASVEPPGGEGSTLQEQLIAHTIRVLRQWDEEELATAFTNTVIRHEPEAMGAIAAGWIDE